MRRRRNRTRRSRHPQEQGAQRSVMWIVRLALSRPYTFVVMALVILLLGGLAIVTTPTDIFPEIDIPVVSVIWNYDGLTTDEMASRITTFSRVHDLVDGQRRRQIESQTYPGVGVIKIYFQPNVNVEAALAQVTAVSQTILRRMPPGAVPPIILQYNASSVPDPAARPSAARRSRSRSSTTTASIDPHAARPDPGHHPAAAVRRQAAPDHGRSRSAGAAGARRSRRRTSPTRSTPRT